MEDKTIGWAGEEKRKDDDKEEPWYHVWLRSLYAAIRSDAWYLEAILYAAFLILLTWGESSSGPIRMSLECQLQAGE